MLQFIVLLLATIDIDLSSASYFPLFTVVGREKSPNNLAIMPGDSDRLLLPPTLSDSLSHLLLLLLAEFHIDRSGVLLQILELLRSWDRMKSSLGKKKKEVSPRCSKQRRVEPCRLFLSLHLPLSQHPG